MTVTQHIIATMLLADAGEAAAWALLAVLLIGLIVLFLRVQTLGQNIESLRGELKRLSERPAVPPAPLAAPPSPAPASVPTPAPVSTPAPAPVASKPAGLEGPELVAVLTAAATAVLGRRVAVRRITFINQNTVSGWAEAGRLSIHTSHNVRRN